jgi:hypothetical protein
MKKIYLILTLAIIVIYGCGGIKTLSTGLDNEAFLEFVGKPNDYEGGLSVSVDEKTTFVAEVNKDKATKTKGRVYAISTGIHNVSVSYKNKLLYKKQIFISSQETKKIILP